ncbi:MAG: T9SS type A sorting domain-containing protein [Flavobacteriales bacterium]|nr:T9SS type A sorting domain-containing protein [Flavobacteriales bacterium]
MDLTSRPANIFDIAGQLVLTATLQNDQLDISALKSGIHLFQLQLNGRLLQQKFVKRRSR